MFTYSQYGKNNDREMHFKKHARKWRLEDVSVTKRFIKNND